MYTAKIHCASGKCLLFALVLLAASAQAQFSTLASHTRYVCNASGHQFGVQAFADGAGGAYQVWIDKRGGNNSGPGTALYVQHLDAAGTALLPANGLRLHQTRGRDIFGLKAVPWQSGLLVAWVQGGFGLGGDTVRCQYYSTAGVAQWAAPTLLAAINRPTIVYASENGLNVLPNDSGATITHGLVGNGGGAYFTFNRVSATGRRRWPLNHQQVYVAPNGTFQSDYYHTLGDGGNGFYLVASAGGFGSPIFAQHFTLLGAAWPAFTTVSAGGASGRGSDWRLQRDPANNLYVVWGSNAGDPLVAKILPTGALGWPAPGYRSLCANPSRQTDPDALWHNNALWVLWNDDRTPASFQSEYLQKVDATGALAWPGTGVLVNNLPGSYTYPRLAASDNGAVMAFYATAYGQGFRAQKVRPDASLVFPVNGVALHTVDADRPNGLDYVPVSQPNGSVQVYWASPGGAPTGQDICAGRMQSSGTLLGAAERAAEATGFAVYPNPARAGVRLSVPEGLILSNLRLFDAQGRLVRTFATPATALSLQGIPAGLYVLRASLAGREVSRRLVVEP